MSDVKGRENFLSCGYAKQTQKIVLPRARLVDASVRAELAPQLHLWPY